MIQKSKNFKLLFLALGLCLFLFFISIVWNEKNGKNEESELAKVKTIVKNSEKIHDVYMEASPFVWNGELKYFMAERRDKEKFHQLAIYDFKTRKKEAEFGKDLGLASATVIDDVLYITATKDWFNFSYSEIYLITSTDLKNFSRPRLIYKAHESQKIFNTSLTKNSKNGNFVIVFESHDDTSTPFTHYFLESKDGKAWRQVNGAIFGKDVYVACPSIKYLEGYYYLIYSMQEYFDPNCLECRSFVTKISRSKDLKEWKTSPHQFLTADRKDEGINNSDVDFVEYEGKSYIFYAIGDQTTWGGSKYAVYGGSIKDMLKYYFQ